MKVLVAAISAAALAWPVWKSVRYFIQARRLLGWRRSSLEGLDGQTAALRGEVRVSQPVRTKMMGDCLWHRRFVRVHHVLPKSSFMETESDVSLKAEFSIVIDGRDCVIGDLPTRVFGAQSKRTFGGGNKAFYFYWLPVVGYLTVLGRVRQKGSRWEIEQDPKVGLIYSVHPAERTAVREIVKGGLWLAIAGLGLLALYLFLDRAPD